MKTPKTKITLNLPKLIIAIAICEGAGVIGSVFTISAIPTWYNFLSKPFFSPPNYIFGPVWALLYVLMGIALYLIWMEGKKAKGTLVIFGIHLLVNASWSIIFFGLKSPLLGFLDILVLWVLIVLVIYKFWNINKLAGIILIPYFVWVSFAAVLNLNIYILNKSHKDVTEIPPDVKESIKNKVPQKSFNVPIFLYHYVEYVKDPGDTIRQSLNINPFIFEQQVKTLQDAGYTFITISDLSDALDGKITLPEKSVILTFDDGYKDFYTDVFPILKKYQAKAVIYIVPSFLDKPNNLSSGQLEELAQSDLVEIGAHTMYHAYLTGLPEKVVADEIEESRKYLEKNFQVKVLTFAYPYGAFDKQAIDLVRKAGFTSGITTIQGISASDVNRFFLYRIRPGGRMGDLLLSLIQQEIIESTK